MSLKEMFKNYVPKIGTEMNLVFINKMKVEKRTVHYMKTINGMIDAIEYAKAEGADFVFFDKNIRVPIYSTKDASCVCVTFPKEEDILDFTYIFICIVDSVKNDKMLYTRYYLSLIKPQYLIDKINEHKRIMDERLKELEEGRKKREEELERWFKEG